MFPGRCGVGEYVLPARSACAIAGRGRARGFVHLSHQGRRHSAGAIVPGDGFPDDDRASVELPALANFGVTVYSNQPELLKPFLDANPQVAAIFRSPARVRQQR